MNFRANKIIVISLLTILLILLGFYDNKYNGEEYRIEKRKNPEWNLGGIYVKQVTDSFFYADGIRDSIVGINYKKALPKGENLQIGDLLQIKSIHLNGDTVDVKFIHISRTRTYKIWLSVIPVFIIFFLFFKYFRFNKEKFIFEER